MTSRLLRVNQMRVFFFLVHLELHALVTFPHQLSPVKQMKVSAFLHHELKRLDALEEVVEASE